MADTHTHLYRFLLNSHTHSPLARAMNNAIKLARVNDKFQDPLYLFLELVRAGVMHGHLWSGRAFSGGPSFGVGMSFPNHLFAFFGWISAAEFVLGSLIVGDLNPTAPVLGIFLSRSLISDLFPFCTQRQLLGLRRGC